MSQDAIATTESANERASRLGLSDIKPTRMESLDIASPLVNDNDFELLARATRLYRTPTIVLPPHRFESLSRGRGWCRKGKGRHAEWGERVDDGKTVGYRVGPGHWSVGGDDGFSRRKSDEWTVQHVQVGDKTWTIAN